MRAATESDSHLSDQGQWMEWIDHATKEEVVRLACQWIDDLAEWNEPQIIEIRNKAISILREWQNHVASVARVRQAAFDVHRLARQTTDPRIKCAFRYVGHLLATVHVKTHLKAALRYRAKLPLPPVPLPIHVKTSV